MLGTGVHREGGPFYGGGRLLAPSIMLVCKHLIATSANGFFVRWYAVHLSHKVETWSSITLHLHHVARLCLSAQPCLFLKFVLVC